MGLPTGRWPAGIACVRGILVTGRHRRTLCKDYLAELIGNTEGHVVADLVNGLTHSIGQAARGTNPALQDDPNFPEFRMSRERGPLVSTEEQRVWGGRARGSRVIPETDPIFRLASDEGVACNGS